MDLFKAKSDRIVTYSLNQFDGAVNIQTAKTERREWVLLNYTDGAPRTMLYNDDNMSIKGLSQIFPGSVRRVNTFTNRPAADLWKLLSAIVIQSRNCTCIFGHISYISLV